jgi:UPF0716 protein FxsA
VLLLGRFLLLFILVPLIEIVLLIRIHEWTSAQLGQDEAFWLMVGLIGLTGLVGGFLAKRSGMAILTKLRARMAQGEMPGQQLIDGAIVLFCGALLLTPGVLTDVVGFLGLFPPTRALFRAWALERLKRGVERGTVKVQFNQTMHTHQPQDESNVYRNENDVIDVNQSDNKEIQS